MFRGILAVTALAVIGSGVATADSIATFTTSVGPTVTDVVNDILMIPAFDPGFNGVPVGATLVFYTVSVTESINGTVDVTNNNRNPLVPSAEFGVDTLGALSIGTPLAGDGQPDGFGNDAANDVFGGNGPDPTVVMSVGHLAAGASTGPLPFSASSTVTTGDIMNTAPTAPPDPITLYFSTYTNQNSHGLGGNGTGTDTDFVTLSATVTYDYVELPGVPEPTTMLLMGGALLGLGLLRKRVRG